ncbi:hypothetical protein DEI93_09705 [Curtobacterium sp. MCBD17_035]|uniref:hypothetical protein n=1 Tax=Curtobacterium sp. MCBD17_035 TaxID=2175673 RepID=UPI0011B5DC2A|nr:hypothetical protein [Curtobacterium sp. MCBD17_035]WIB66267.1 hypothetical protein DEI93_09705 [Curtobacterium sp. MCBD17_035]
MRFVLAIISFVIGVVLVGLGVGQRTVFAPPSSTVASTTTTGDAPVTVIPGRTLVANAGHQRVRVSGGTGTAFAAYGRTADVMAWVGKARHNTIRYDAETTSLRDRVSGTQRHVPSPKGSDLWYGEYEGHTLDFTVDLPADTALVIVSNGSDPAPAHLSVTWPRDTATPLVGPLMTAGGFFVALGIALYIWAIIHQRRLRGPRRRSGGTRPPRARVSRRRAVAAGAQVPPRPRRGRRMVAVVPVVALTTLALAGCSSEYWPHGTSGTPTPTPTVTATAGPAAAAEPTAATLPQIRRIVARVAAVAAQADSSRNATTAAERFTGSALDLRKANYTIRGSDTDVDAPPTIPSSGISVALPQQTDTWPRSVFVVLTGSQQQKDVAPQALTLVQASPRAQYKVEYDVSLEADAKLPSVAPVTTGAAQLSPDVKLLTLPPGQVASAYADILANDTASQYADVFSSEGDELRQKIGKSYKDQKAKSLSSTAKIAYSSEVPSADSSIALATNGAGALVSTSLDEIEKVTPTQSGATLNTEGAVKALSKVGSSTKGISATYGVQVLFSVPPVGSKAKIELLGFTQGLIAASEVQ